MWTNICSWEFCCSNNGKRWELYTHTHTRMHVCIHTQTLVLTDYLHIQFYTNVFLLYLQIKSMKLIYRCIIVICYLAYAYMVYIFTLPIATQCIKFKYNIIKLCFNLLIIFCGISIKFTYCSQNYFHKFNIAFITTIHEAFSNANKTQVIIKICLK